MARTVINKREQVVHLLQDAILCGQLRPGTRLAEIRLGRDLGVSQAIIREALQELEGLGLILKRPGQGSYVIELTADDLVYIYQVRSELESLACALAARVFNQQTYEALQACILEMRAAARADDFLAYARADVRFHRCIWASQSNRFLEKSLETICLPLFAYDQIRRATTTMDYERVTRQHELILAVLRTGDPDRVARLMRHMMQRWLRIHLHEYDRNVQQPLESASQPDAFDYLRSQTKRLWPRHDNL
jgi:DNA-binding GntR family transcriptional regulator